MMICIVYGRIAVTENSSAAEWLAREPTAKVSEAILAHKT